MGLLLAEMEVASSVAGIGAGATDGEPGVNAIPSVGWVQKTPNANMTVGMGLFAVARETPSMKRSIESGADS